ncbi:MAG: tetratricopeptide repeat protein [Candidatus Muiribacteriota bacterium]
MKQLMNYLKLMMGRKKKFLLLLIILFSFFTSYGDYWNNLLEIANNYMKHGQYRDAINTYKELLQNSPDVAEIHNNMGIAYKELDEFKNALHSFRKALDLKPDFPEVLNNIAVLYVENMINLDVALSFAHKAYSLKPAPHTLNTIGDIYYARGMLEKALEYYDRVVKKDEFFFGAYLKKAEIFLDFRRYDRALENIKFLKQNEYHNIKAYLKEVLILKKLDRFADAHVRLLEIINQYNEFRFTKEEESQLISQITSYFRTTVWTAALNYYRIINPDTEDYEVDKIRPYTKVFYEKEVPFEDVDGSPFFINRNFYVESSQYGINPNIFPFINYFAQNMRDVFRESCYRNQEIINIAIGRFLLVNDKAESLIEFDDIIPFLPADISCPQGGEYTIDNGEIICDIHGKLY